MYGALITTQNDNQQHQKEEVKSSFSLMNSLTHLLSIVKNIKNI
jgi:hypothetical protein